MYITHGYIMNRDSSYTHLGGLGKEVVTRL